MNALQWDEQSAATLGALLVLLALLWLAVRKLRQWIADRDVTADNALTVLAAAVGAAFSAQGMWGFFRATLHLPVTLTALGFFFFELVQLVCALRARRKMLDPAFGKPGAEGTMLWISAGLTGFFSATHASTWPEVAFRLLVPSVAAWLWHQLMKLEHRKATGKLSGIHWRVTPERLLAFLRLAEPTARTTQQVTATRALEALAMAVQRAWSPLFGWDWLARRRVRRALRRAVRDADLDTDADAQRKLRATLAVLGGADTLIELRPTAPWVAVDDDQIARARRLIEDGGVEINDRLRILLGVPPTDLPQPRPGRLPSMFVPLKPFAQTPSNGPSDNRNSNQPNLPVVAGPDGKPDVRATVAATVAEINKLGVGEQKLAADLEVKRHWIRKLLGRDSQPASTAANGAPTGGRP